jgi:hypothetical protein
LNNTDNTKPIINAIPIQTNDEEIAGNPKLSTIEITAMLNSGYKWLISQPIIALIITELMRPMRQVKPGRDLEGGGIGVGVDMGCFLLCQRGCLFSK